MGDASPILCLTSVQLCLFNLWTLGEGPLLGEFQFNFLEQSRRNLLRTKLGANVATQQTQAVRTKERQTRALELLQASQAALVNDPSESVDDAMQSARIATLSGTEDVLRAALVADHERMQLPAGGPATQGAYSRDGSQYAVGSSSGSVRVYSTATGTLVRSLAAAGPVTSLAWSPDGKTVAVGSAIWRGSAQMLDR